MKRVAVHTVIALQKICTRGTTFRLVERWFESPSFSFYAKMELLLQSAPEGKEIPEALLMEVVDHFVDDL